MEFWVYFMGSLYMISSLFRFSKVYSTYIFRDRVRQQRIEEMIYSTLHSSTLLLLSGCALQENICSTQLQDHGRISEMMKFATAFSLSYFSMDLIQCISKLNMIFVLHHICAIHLLYMSSQKFNRVHEGSFVMAYLFLLEWNTPLMNLGTLLKMMKFDYYVYGSVWVLHLISYTLCRLIMIPYITYYYYHHYGIDYYQLPNLAIIYGGSCYWAYKQLCGIQKRILWKEKEKGERVIYK